MKNIRVFYLNISVFVGEVFYIFESACFRNVTVKALIRLEDAHADLRVRCPHIPEETSRMALLIW